MSKQVTAPVQKTNYRLDQYEQKISRSQFTLLCHYGGVDTSLCWQSQRIVGIWNLLCGSDCHLYIYPRKIIESHACGRDPILDIHDLASTRH